MILGKYLAWLSSTLVAVVAGWMILPKGFSEVADWLGPLLGPSFRPLLVFIFILVGPPLSYHPLAYAWVASGASGGFFATGVRRAMAAGAVSKLTLIVLTLASGYILVSGLAKLLNFSAVSNFPPPPPGTNLSDILNAPLVGDMIALVTASGGPNLVSIATLLIMNATVNTVFFASSFIISGHVFGRIFHRSRTRTPSHQPVEDVMPKPAAPPTPSPTPSPTPAPAPVTKILTVLILTLLVLGAAQPIGFAQPPGSPGAAGEQLVLDLHKDGSLHAGYSTNVTSLPSVPSDYSRVEYQSLLAAAILSRNGTTQTGQTGIPSFLLSLLPRNGFLAAYQLSDPSVGKSRADILASEFGQGFNVNLQYSTSLILPPLGGQAGNVYLAVYQCQEDAGTKILSLAQADGVGTILTAAKIFVSNYAITAGFLNFESTSATLSPSVGMEADLTALGNFYGSGRFTLGLRETFGAQGTIGPSTTAKITSIELLFPANSIVVAYAPGTASVDSALGEYWFAMNTTDSSVPNAYVTFDATFPQHITIDREVNPSSTVSTGTTLTETITVKNLGNTTVNGALVSEKNLFQTYPTIQLLSPSFNVTIGDIGPQESRAATLQFTVGSDGVYTLPPVNLEYVDRGQLVNRESAEMTLISHFNTRFYLEKLVRGTAPYSYLFLLFIVLPPIRETVKQVRRLSSRKRQR